MSYPIPVIKLEVEHMRHTMAIALTQYTAQLDEMLQGAIESYCTPDNLERIIYDEAHKAITQVLKEEVKNWFIHGEGRKIIREAVKKKLEDRETWTPLDWDDEI